MAKRRFLGEIDKASFSRENREGKKRAIGKTPITWNISVSIDYWQGIWHKGKAELDAWRGKRKDVGDDQDHDDDKDWRAEQRQPKIKMVFASENKDKDDEYLCFDGWIDGRLDGSDVAKSSFVV